MYRKDPYKLDCAASNEDIANDSSSLRPGLEAVSLVMVDPVPSVPVPLVHPVSSHQSPPYSPSIDRALPTVTVCLISEGSMSSLIAESVSRSRPMEKSPAPDFGAKVV